MIYKIFHIDCSPINNKLLLYLEKKSTSYSYSLTTLEIVTKQLENLIISEVPNYIDAHYSPDGETIVFSNWDEIFTINSDGSNLKQLTDYPTGSAIGCAWSPDGDYNIYGFSSDNVDKYSYSVLDKEGNLQDKIVEANRTKWNMTFAWTD